MRLRYTPVRVLAFAAVAGAAAVGASTQSVTPSTPTRAVRGTPAGPLVDFQRQIRPLLSDHCLECHSQDKRKGGLSLATYADALEGGATAPVIRPGNSARSLLDPSRHRRGRTADAEGRSPAGRGGTRR